MSPARPPRRGVLALRFLLSLVIGALVLDVAPATGAMTAASSADGLDAPAMTAASGTDGADALARPATPWPASAGARRGPAPSHEIYGYLPYWNLGTQTARRLDYSGLSTIAFFGVGVGADGSLDRRSPGYRAFVGRNAAAVTAAAHARGVRVVPTFVIFASSKLGRLLASRAAQTRFIRQALALMASRQADGASLDVEPVPTAQAERFAAFVGRFSRAMHRRFPRSQLTVATPAIVSDALLRGLAPVVDRLFVMTYDYHRSGSSTPGPVAPLAGGPHNVAKTTANYLRLVPPGKLILGVPYYGYSWPVVQVGRGWRVRPNPARWGGVRGVTYASVLQWLAAHPKVRVQGDPSSGSWFRYWDKAKRTAREVHFEDARSAKAKFDFAIAHGLAGIGIWALRNDQGRVELARAVDAVFVHPTRRVTVSASVSSVRLRRGRVEVTASVVIRDSGTRAERGTLTWRILGRSGRTIRSGHRLEAVYPGSQVKERLAISLGPASKLRAGTYRFVVRFDAGGVVATATKRFRQRY